MNEHTENYMKQYNFNNISDLIDHRNKFINLCCDKILDSNE